ncbi:hypothetical protein [Nitrospirillum viridazoti]|uniref:Secreted protein n=1 Tax=Nitrospirillum amazonense TaxID=28077 RepID=A0A560IUY7_9PROT|nr:hypothetical protein [Nitrospirillum amazonense]TWB62245.1 hypothetical protein FBZ92_105180 [Nitrospirillum amazonense]
MAEPKTRGTTRRAFLPALAAGAAVITVPATAPVFATVAKNPALDPDAELLQAWERWTVLMSKAYALPATEGWESPVTEAALDAVEAAEAAFRAIPARTPAGFALKLKLLWLDLNGRNYVGDYIFDGIPMGNQAEQDDLKQYYLTGVWGQAADLADAFLAAIQQCEGVAA